MYESSAEILVTAGSLSAELPADAITDRTIQNQVALLTSQEVAQSVARAAGRPGAVAEFAGSVTATAQTGRDFVTITARRPSAKDAASTANAFAQAFLRLRSSQERKRVSAALQETRRQLDEIPRRTSNLAQRAELQDAIRRLELMLSVGSGSAEQLDSATPPSAPASPRPIRDSFVAAVVALLGSIALAYALEIFDRRLKRVEDVASAYGLPVLGIIPHCGRSPATADSPAAISVALKEPMRQLRSNIRLTSDTVPRRLLVTSAIAGEGKTTVARNLAIAMREAGLRVAVVDADLRRGTLAPCFGQPAEPGLTDVLLADRRLDETLVHVPVRASGLQTVAKMEGVATMASGSSANDGPEVISEEITLLASGPEPADPQTVLAAERTHGLLDEISQSHDVVIIDSAPMLPVADTVPLASWADGIVFVARLDLLNRDNVQRLVELLQRIPHIKPIGVVVNDVSVSDSAGYGYGDGYGYGQKT